MKRIILAGFIGGVLFLVWFIIVDGIFGFKRSTEMNNLGVLVLFIHALEGR